MTTRTVNLIVGVALLVGACLAAFYGPRAWSAEPPRTGSVWQMWAAKPGEEWKPVHDRSGGIWNFASGSACNVDIVSVARGLPDGSMVACRRFDRKATAQ